VCSLRRAPAAASGLPGGCESGLGWRAGAASAHRAGGRGDGVCCWSYHGGVYGWSVDQPPCQRDDHKVELAPRVAQVGLSVPDEAIREHLGQQLEGEDAQVGPLADANEARLQRRPRMQHLVEGRLPRHRGAVGLQRPGITGSRWDVAESPGAVHAIVRCGCMRWSTGAARLAARPAEGKQTRL